MDFARTAIRCMDGIGIQRDFGKLLKGRHHFDESKIVTGPQGIVGSGVTPGVM